MLGLNSTPSTASPSILEAEDDWEYEYDQDETDEFYFTIDLTTHVPDALVSKQKSANGKLMPTVPIDDADDHDDDPDDEQDETNPQQRSPARAPLHRQANDEPSNLQVLDLHSDAPLIKFGDNVYRGQWSTDLGSQIYVSRPMVIDKPLRPGNIVDVIGISRARLLCRPVTLQQRPDWIDDTDITRTETSPDVSDDAEEAFPDLAARPTLVPRENLVKPEHKIQASFLERLSKIKIKKGELDPVPATHSVIKYENPPEGWETIRQQALAHDEQKTQERRKREAEAAAELSAQVRKRRRRKRGDDGLQTAVNGATADGLVKTIKSRAGAKPHEQIRAALGLQAAPDDDRDDERDDHQDDDQSHGAAEALE